MSRTRHEQVTEVFAAARRLAVAQREAYLDEVCGGDAGLRADIEALLAQDARALSQIDAAIDGGAARVLARELAIAPPCGHSKSERGALRLLVVTTNTV